MGSVPSILLFVPALLFFLQLTCWFWLSTCLFGSELLISLGLVIHMRNFCSCKIPPITSFILPCGDGGGFGGGGASGAVSGTRVSCRADWNMDKELGCCTQRQ